MRMLKLTVIAFPLVLGACATALPPGITAQDAGFSLVADKTRAATGRKSVWLQTSAQSQQVA